MVIGRVFLEPHLQLNREGKSLESGILTLLGIEANNIGMYFVNELPLFRNLGCEVKLIV